MSIQSIQSAIISGLKSGTDSVCKAAAWAGRNVTTFVGPSLSKVWALTQQVAAKALAYAKNGPFYPLAIAAGLFGIGSAFWSFADANEESQVAATALKLAAIAAFTAGTVATGLSIAAIAV